MAHKTLQVTTSTTASVAVLDDGDIESPLKKVMSKYLAKAKYIRALGHDASYYSDAAKRIHALLYQFEKPGWELLGGAQPVFSGPNQQPESETLEAVAGIPASSELPVQDAAAGA